MLRVKDMNVPSTLLCGTVWMGLEEIAQSELKEKLDNCAIVDVSRELFGDGKRKIFFTTSASVSAITQLRTFEDVSICYFRDYFLQGKKTLNQLSRQISKVLASPKFFQTLQYHKQVAAHNKKINRPSFKVIGTMKGRHDFRRVDAVQTVQDVIQSRFRRWRFSLENPTLEFWLDIADSKSSFFLRLSQKPFSQRTYKTESYEGSLPPTIAYALARLSEPAPNERFMDPMCGSGTIVAERLLFDLGGLVLGGDVNFEAVEKCRAITHRLKSSAHVSLCCWNAMQLPLKDGAIDKIACNLPFGKKFPVSQETLIALVDEFARVVRPNGICVLLTQSRSMFQTALKRCGEWDVKKRFVINLLGLRPYVYKLRRR
ncbi:MAG: methyltransferase domain-containing protein [Candidatus Poribacteria bacterium]